MVVAYCWSFGNDNDIFKMCKNQIQHTCACKSNIELSAHVLMNDVVVDVVEVRSRAGLVL